MQKIKLLIICLVFISLNVKGDEGMWIPSLLKKYTIKEMKKAGFRLSAKDIYNINKASMKDAIVGLSSSNAPTTFWASGSFISSTGLVLTNHHCAVSYLQKHSSQENNYLKDGFFATSRKAELPANGLCLSRLVSIEDVTSYITDGLDKIEEAKRSNVINGRAKELIKEATVNTNYEGKVRPYFAGNQYFMEIYEVYRDVRLVAMPPLSLAKFGGETDNWAWPRQSADFCILRVYGDSNNQSLKYSPENVPVVPVNFLELSTNGYKENDFALVMGFPGNTKQFLTSRALTQLVDVTNYHSIKIRDARVDILNRAMEKNDELWLKYMEHKGRTSNILKRWKAESQGIERLGLINKKKSEEVAFKKWVNSSRKLNAKYGDVITDIEGFCDQLDTLEKLNAYVMEAGISGTYITPFVAKFDRLYALSSRYKAGPKSIARELKRLKMETENFFSDFDIQVEKELLTTMVRLYDENIEDFYTPLVIKLGRVEFKGDFDAWMDSAFKESIFSSKERLGKFLDSYTNDDVKILESDPLFKLCLSFYLVNRDQLIMKRNGIRSDYGKVHKKYIAGILEMKKGQNIAPDANRSLRVSYGNIKGYSNNDVKYSHLSTLNGLVEKHDRDSRNYPLPDNYLSHSRKTISAQNDGQNVPVCFITTAHTTSGNSGSPVIDADGKLIGLVFDRSGYGLVSDFEFMPQCSRSIAVDIRYVLFVLKHQLNAQSLVDEWKN